MAYAQWVVITVKARNTSLSIRNAHLSWGKFYQNPNKDQELSADDINKIVIPANNNAVIASCGRSDSASGTEGSFDIYDGQTNVGNYYWNCPWGSKTNTSTWTPNDTDRYVTQVTGGNLDSGALGNISIDCVKVAAAVASEHLEMALA